MTATALTKQAAVSPFLRPPRAVYAHVPFCSHKCGYCDFASVAGRVDQTDRYLAALEREIDLVCPEPVAVDTVFVGGGTPTLLAPAQLRRLLGFVRDRFPLAVGGEFTVESNPNTLTRDKVAALTEAGVNRVSLGAQSFDANALKVLEREHDPASVAVALDMLRPAVAEVSVDMIFGVPGQSPRQWADDLRRALDLGTTHVSTYGLTYEPGTRLWRQREAGLVTAAPEDDEADMYEHAMATMTRRGWLHYEISSFAAPRVSEPDPRRLSDWAACRHNWTYWTNLPYYGFGTGAAAFVDGVRTVNTRNLDGYLRRIERGERAVSQSETLTAAERARETAMLHLRRHVGLDRAEFRAMTGVPLAEVVGDRLVPFVGDDLLADDGRSVRLTDAGRLLADGILLAALGTDE